MNTLYNNLKLLVFLGMCSFSLLGKAQCYDPILPGSDLVDFENQQVLASFVDAQFLYEAELVYIHSESSGAEEFFETMEGIENTLLVMKTDAGFTIGAFNEAPYGNDEEFVYGLDNNFIFSLELGLKYDAVPGQVHYIRYPSGPYFQNFSVGLSINNAGNYCSGPPAVNSYDCECDGYCPAQLNNGIVTGGNALMSYSDFEVWALKTSGEQIGEDSDNDGVCDGEEVAGCQDPEASNYNSSATDPGDCDYIVGCYSELLPGSNIVSSVDQNFITTWIENQYEYEAELVFDTEVSGFVAEDFHNACDGLSNTLIVAVSEAGNVFGGFNEGEWNSDGAVQSGLDGNFLFSITNQEKYLALSGEGHIYNGPNQGPVFGDGLGSEDWFTFSSSTPGVLMLNELGNSYACPAANPTNCELYLNNGIGWNNFNDRFRIANYEVWQLNTSGAALVDEDPDNDGICVDDEIVGCQDPEASNYDSSATDPGDCEYILDCSALITPGSGIVSPEDQDFIVDWVEDQFHFEAELVFDTEVSGFQASEFHAACDGLSNTLVLAVSAEGNVFGGFNEGVWGSDGAIQSGLDGNFLFSITNEQKYNAISGQTHIYNGSPQGPVFGDNFNPDWFTGNSTGPIVIMLNELGNSYECPANTLSACQLFLNNGIGWNNFDDRFSVTHYEVWQLNTFGLPLVGEDADDDGECDLVAANPGCTDAEACNYDANANDDDGSCVFTTDLAEAGPDLENCQQFGTFGIFNPEGVIPAGYTGTWTVQSGPANITIATQNNASPQVTIAPGESSVLRLTLTQEGGGCTSFDEMTITNHEWVGNPNAGPDQSACQSGDFMTGATPVTVGEGEWTWDNPAILIGDDIQAVTELVNLPEGESVTLTWTVTNGTCENSDQVTVTNYAAPTQADIAEDFSFCPGTVFSLQGNQPALGSGSWSVTDGSGSFNGFGINVAGVLPDGETTTYRYTIVNGDCSSSDEITVTNDENPIPANAGSNFIGCAPLTLNANAASVGSGVWSSSASGISFSDINDPNSGVSGLTVGANTLTWTITNGTCITADNVNVGLYPNGCNDPEAINYDGPNICDDGSCEYETNNGCADSEACNYDPEAPAGSTDTCIYPDGCTDEEAVNYNYLASCDDGSCVYAGCTQPSDINYNPLAIYDDGSCESYGGDNCPGDFNGDNAVTVGDLSGFLAAFGTSCNSNNQ